MANQITNPGPHPTVVRGLRPGGDPFVPDPVVPGNTLHGIGGEEFGEFIRYSIFLRDLNRCDRWMKEAEQSSDDVRDGLHIAALITFCTCFEGTAGHRTRPLSQKKVFDPEQRAIFKELLRVRNTSVAHDDQGIPVNSVAIELDGEGNGIHLSSGIGFFTLRGRVLFDSFPGLLLAARAYTYAERDKAADAALADFNARDPGFKADIKASAPFAMTVKHEDLLGR